MPRCWQSGTLLLAALLACGCASRRCCQEVECGGVAMLDCEPVERQTLAPDVAAVSPLSGVQFEARSYCRLTVQQAQCLAATNAPLARLLEQEAQALEAQPGGLHRDRCSQQDLQQILYLQATHERNRAAAAALQLFFRLAEAEAGVDNVKARLEELSKLLADVQRLQAAGVASTLSQATVEAQQLELVHKQVDLEGTIDELNHQLVNLLGVEPPPEKRLWPDADLKVNPAVPSVEASQQLAFEQRADLAALRLAADQDLDVMRALLGQTNAGLGMALGGCRALSLLHVAARREEECVRGDQLSSAADEQERTIEHDVASAVATIEARLMQIGLSKRRLEAVERQHERTLQKRQIDPAAAFEARRAKLEVLAAEQDLMHDVIEWKLAAVKLRELQEELAMECGFFAAECQ